MDRDPAARAAEGGGLCLLELQDPETALERADRLVLYRWGRRYPADPEAGPAAKGLAAGGTDRVPRPLPRHDNKGDLHQMKRTKQAALSLLLLLCLLLSACGTAAPAPSFDLEDIPEFSGEPYVVLEDNRPNFPEEEWSAEPFEEYSPLDSLGRCGPAYACVGLETMPTEERGSIGPGQALRLADRQV